MYFLSIDIISKYDAKADSSKEILEADYLKSFNINTSKPCIKI